jgi:hypothetical protein
MDNDRRPRQTLAGYAGLQPQPSYPVVSASERYRQQPPTSAPASGSRASTSSQSYGYAYGEGSQFVGPPIQQPGYAHAGDYAGHAEQPPQRASQQYQPYGQSAMYNVPGAPAPATATSQYEPVQQYQQARESTMGVLGSEFGVRNTTVVYPTRVAPRAHLPRPWRHRTFLPNIPPWDIPRSHPPSDESRWHPPTPPQP